MNGYIEFAPGPVGTGLDGAVRLFRKVWPVVASHTHSVEAVVRPGRHRGWGNIGQLLMPERPWARLGPLSALGKNDAKRLQELSELTLEVFYLVPIDVARSVVAALSGTERQRRDDLLDLPLTELECSVLDGMLNACVESRSFLVGTADEGNLVYVFGDTALLTTVE